MRNTCVDRRTTWPTAAAVGLLLAAAGVPTGVASADGDKCKAVGGGFTSVLVSGPNCPSPVGICTHGLLAGDLDATYDFVMLTLEPDPADPAALVYTGVSVIETGKGDLLFGEDTGVMYPGPDGRAPFVTTVTVVGGTGKYRTGRIVASGVLDLVTGGAVGAYEGELCKGKE